MTPGTSTAGYLPPCMVLSGASPSWGVLRVSLCRVGGVRGGEVSRGSGFIAVLWSWFSLLYSW